MMTLPPALITLRAKFRVAHGAVTGHVPASVPSLASTYAGVGSVADAEFNPINTNAQDVNKTRNFSMTILSSQF
jgi:hypothetical protein